MMNLSCILFRSDCRLVRSSELLSLGSYVDHTSFVHPHGPTLGETLGGDDSEIKMESILFMDRCDVR